MTEFAEFFSESSRIPLTRIAFSLSTKELQSQYATSRQSPLVLPRPTPELVDQAWRGAAGMGERVAAPKAQPIREPRREVKALCGADEVLAFLESVQHLSQMMY